MHKEIRSTPKTSTPFNEASQGYKTRAIAARKVLAYLSVWLGWGTTYLAIRVGVKEVAPAAYLAVRFAIAAVILLSVLIVKTKAPRWKWKQVGASALQGLLLLVGGLLPIAYAERNIPSNATAIIIGCAPIGFAFFDRILNGVAINRGTWFGFILGVGGVLILGLGGAGMGASSYGGFDLALLILGVVFWCLGSVVSKTLKVIDSFQWSIAVQYLSVTIALTVFSLAFEDQSAQSISAFSIDVWVSLIYLALVPSLLSYMGYTWLLTNEPLNRVATYAYVNPIVAVLGGAIVLNEPISFQIVIALILVISGTYTNFRSKGKP